MSGEDDGTIPFKRLGAVSDPERVRLLDFAAAEAELTQLRAQNKWLREANKSLSDELEKVRKLQAGPTGASFV